LLERVSSSWDAVRIGLALGSIDELRSICCSLC
jgi:hypothetical protein